MDAVRDHGLILRGGDAVIVFFVLSGFVIAFVANGKEKSIDIFFINRFARLYSVVFPALILTMVFDFAGTGIAYELYDGRWFEAGVPIWRFFSNLFFINQLWTLYITPFSNGPFWSIGYEFWYYVLFALAFYLQKPSKYLLILMVLLLVGPKILLLFPVWLMGVWVYKITVSNCISEDLGWMILISSIIAYLAFRFGGGHAYFAEFTRSYIMICTVQSLSLAVTLLAYLYH